MRNRRQAAANQAAYDALTEASYDSLLTGSDRETTVENVLVLSLGKNGVWFYKYSGTLGANKAYLAQ